MSCTFGLLQGPRSFPDQLSELQQSFTFLDLSKTLEKFEFEYLILVHHFMANLSSWAKVKNKLIFRFHTLATLIECVNCLL